MTLGREMAGAGTGRAKGLVSLSVFGLVGLVLTPGCGRKPADSSLPAAVEITQLAAEDIASQTPYSATIREQHRVDLSFKVPGTVIELLQVPGPDGRLRDIQEGDRAPIDPKKPIARLDDADYRRRLAMTVERLAQAQAREKSLESELVSARNDDQRTAALVKQNAASEQQRDEARARREAFEAELARARRVTAEAVVARQQAEDDLSNCSLVVPLAEATVARRNVEVNERVAANTPVFHLIDISKVKAAFGVPDTRVAEFCLGQPLQIVADAFRGERFEGRVTKIHPAADLKTRTFEIEITIDQPRGLRPGMVVTILTGRQSRRLLLPFTAVRRGVRPGEFAVFVIAEEERRTVARQRAVRLGGVYDNRLEVVAGPGTEIGEGDTVVTVGAARLADGQEVHVSNAKLGQPELASIR